MAYDKINLSDLFDFGDDSELQKAEKAIQRLQQVYQGLQDGIKTKNEEARKSIQALARSLTSLEKKLNAVNIASAEGRKQAAAYAQQVSNDVRVINDLRLGQEKLTKQVGQLEQQNRRLQSAYDKLVVARQKAAKATNAEAGSITHLKQQADKLRKSYEGLAPAVDKAIKEQAIQRMNRLQRAIQTAQGAMTLARRGAIGAAASYAALVQENTKLTKQLREMPNAFDRVTGAINKQNKAAYDLQRQIQQNNTALKKMDIQLGLTQRNVGNYGVAAAEGMKQFALALAGQYLGVMALAEATRVAFQSNLQLSDAQASVRKTVGMTKQEVDGLAESFKKLDTRTSLAGLFEIARVGGQFNVAEEDIVAFTVAADKAAVALGDEFKGGVEEVATALYTLRGLFEGTRDLSPADALLSIGSAINTLGAQGSATGPVIAEFAERLGQLGELGPDIDVALGMGAALQEMGFSAEIAAGGYTNLIVQANKHAPKFAKLLGLTTESFRQMLQADPNEMLLRVAETVYGMENGIEIMYEMGVQSQESIKVLQSMGGRLDFVRGKLAISNQAFTEATSINKEFAIANDTMAGSWEKLKNAIVNSMTSGQIGDSLKYVMDRVREVFIFFKGIENTIGSGALTASINVAGTQGAMADLEALILRYEQLASATSLTAKETEEMGEIFVRLKTRHGENLTSLDAETNAMTVNWQEIDKKREAYKKLLETQKLAAGSALDKLKAEEKRLRDEKRTLQLEADMLKRQMEQGIRQHSGKSIIKRMFDPETKAQYAIWEKVADAAYKKQEQLYQIGLELDDVLLKQKASMQSLASNAIPLANEQYQQLYKTWLGMKDVAPDFKGMIPDGYKPKNGEKEKRSVEWLDKEIANLKNIQSAASDNAEIWNKWQEKINKLEAERTRITGKQKQDMKAVLDAAREARHELIQLRANRAAERAEWAVEDAGEDYDKEKAAIDLLTEKEIAAAKRRNEEKIRHNKAGNDGLKLLAEELAWDIEQLERRKEERHKAALKRKEDREKEYAERHKKMMEKYAEFEKDIYDDVVDAMVKAGEKELAAQEAKKQAIADMEKQIEQAKWDLAGEMVAGYYELQQAYADLQLEHLQHNKQKELEAVGDNAEAKAMIEENYRKQELKMRQRQAKLAKQEALFNIALSTAQGVMNAMSSPAGAPFTFILAGLVAAMGAVQAATVMAKPLPAYFTGTKSAKAGYATVAEQGAELIQSRSGQVRLVEDPSVIRLQGGERIYNAKETQGILSRSERVQQASGAHALVDSYESSHRAILQLGASSERASERVARQIGMYTSRVTDAVGRQQQLIVSINRDGVSTARRNGQQFNTYENTKYRRR